MNDCALRVEGLCIKYKPYRNISFKDKILKKNKSEKVIEALNDLSFEVNKGEIIGIVGRNGSGKSTLLKAIAGIFKPDQGEIGLFDNSVALMSIGVGFLPDISGRENIVLSGMLLGFSEVEINTKMEEIIEFSELENFIDLPVRTYSSGMYSKLAFSISAFLETDILLIDEVLSVGDEHFRKKSLEKMKQLINDRNRTVLLVSHSNETVKTLCNRVLWLDGGNLIKLGETEDVMTEYIHFMNNGYKR